MTIMLSKLVGRSQMPGDDVAFERIARAFAAAQTPRQEAKKGSHAETKSKPTKSKSSARLSDKVPA